MKNFIPDELSIIQHYTDHVDGIFRFGRYGIKPCTKGCCSDLKVLRYELLKYQLNADCYDSITSLTAGVDRRIKLPVDSLTLTGVFTGVDTLDTISWTQVSGDPATIVTPNALITEVTGLLEGEYSFNLQVITYGGLILEDTVIVTVLEATPATEVISWGYSSTNPYINIVGSGSFIFQFEMDFYSGTNVFTDLDFTADANEQYLVLKEPLETTIKTSWYNTAFNFGTIPDQVFRTPVTYQGYRYYVSRIPVALGTTTTKITFS